MLLAAAVAASTLSLSASAAALDSDGDGLRDDFERAHGVTDHLEWDSDGDGVVDSAEDNDGDRLGNLGEQRFGTDPGRRDSDGDGTPDGKEDADRDGRTNAREQDQRPLPAGLTPSLRDADDDRQPDRQRCQAGKRVSWVVSCTFGDPAAETTLALVGDSHLTMYLTAYRRIAEQRGWRLVTMTKAACPAFLGMHGLLQYGIDKGAGCRTWRRAVLERLEADPPDYIVYGHANYKLVTFTGARIAPAELPQVWRSSIRRTLRQLPAGTRVLVLGRVPFNRTDPRTCLRRHPRDISRCTTRAVPTARRAIDNAIRTGALVSGQAYGTLHDKICSYDPCPLVQGHVLLWRDGGHLTETFARQLQPSIARLLQRKLVDAK